MNYMSFDIYAKRPGFFYKNQEKIGSFFGLFLTLLYIVGSLVLFFYYLISTIKRTEIRVYDSSFYSQEMPIIDVDKDKLYFAFGLENPNTSNRYIDESIYTCEVRYIDRIKRNGEFETINSTLLPIERCQEQNFGKNYQHLILKGELNNSYCLKDFDYSLTFAGGYKYERISYIRIKIFPCNKTTGKCKTQNEINNYLTSSYFSILLKDIGLNPSDFKEPTIPTLQDLYTTIDRRLFRTYVLNFGVTEIHTDVGLFQENIDKKNYFQYKKEVQTFSFRDEEEYLSGQEICLVQIRLDDNIYTQKRTYAKISEALSRIGGYMQLLNTAFILISLLVNKVDNELKILNSIFDFDIAKSTFDFKYKSLKDLNKSIPIKKNNKIFFPKNNLLKINENENEKSNNNLIIKTNGSKVRPSIIIFPAKSQNNNNSSQAININKKNHNYNCEETKNKSINSQLILNNNIGDYQSNFSLNKNKSSFQKLSDDYKKEKLKLNFIEYCCFRKNERIKNIINLYKCTKEIYRKKMDISIVFAHHIITEKILLNFVNESDFSVCKQIDISYKKKNYNIQSL